MHKIRFPVAKCFLPLLEKKRYKVAHGGRGSGKSWFFAEQLISKAIGNPSLRVVCIREVQKSLGQSVKRLIEDRIEHFGLGKYFDVQKAEINILDSNGKKRGLIIFQGMQNHTADSIKSLEGYDIAWVEEAQSLSQRSLDLLRPTIRKPQSEIWFSFNPRFASDPVDAFFRCNTEINGKKPSPPENAAIVEVNYWNNPYFFDNEVFVEEMEYDKRRDPDKYKHVWEGGYEARGESRVFHNWTVEEFESPDEAKFLFGADWGFANDPTTMIRGFIGNWIDGKAIPNPNGRHLFLDYEAVGYKLPIDKTPSFFKERVPLCTEFQVRADSARPETIEYCQRYGFPRMVKSSKGPNSIKDGVEFIKSFDVVIHTRCKTTEKEFLHYSYKVDDKTEEVLSELEDKENHIIDPIRYMLELERKARRQRGQISISGPKAVHG